MNLTQLGRGRELRDVPVLDRSLRERRLQPDRVGPRVFAAADAPPLPDVDHHRNPMAPECVEEIVEAGLVDADCRDRPHLKAIRQLILMTVA